MLRVKRQFREYKKPDNHRIGRLLGMDKVDGSFDGMLQNMSGGAVEILPTFENKMGNTAMATGQSKRMPCRRIARVDYKLGSRYSYALKAAFAPSPTATRTCSA